MFSFGDSGGRVFVAQGIDAWANNVFQLGFTCGPDPAAGGPWRCPASVPPGEWLLLPPGRKAGSLPADVRARYEGRTLEMPTAAVLLVVRTLADPDRAGDEAAAREVQKTYQARPLGTHKPTAYAAHAHSGALLRLASYSRNATQGAPGLLAAIAGLSRAFPLRGKAEARAFKELLRAAGLRPGRGFSQRYSSPRDEGIVGAGALLGMDCVDAKIAAGSIGVDLPGGWSFTNASSLSAQVRPSARCKSWFAGAISGVHCSGARLRQRRAATAVAQRCFYGLGSCRSAALRCPLPQQQSGPWQCPHGNGTHRPKPAAV